MHDLIDKLLAFSRFSQTKMNHISTDVDSLIRSVFAASDGSIWLGTVGGGANRWHDGG